MSPYITPTSMDDSAGVRQIAWEAAQASQLRDLHGNPLADDVCIDPFRRDNAEGIAEAAMERACIAAAHAPLPGLVSTPTSGTRPKAPRGALRRAAMAVAAQIATAVGAFVPDRERKRLMDLRKIIGASARGHLAESNVGGDDVLALTLTYADLDAWSPRHISACLQAMRKWFQRREVRFRYVWVAELQERGALHYHVALYVPRGYAIPFADAQGWWPHGMTKTERVRDVVAYLMGYLSESKGHQKDYARFPKGARAYGVGGLTEEFKACNRWLRAPAFVRRLGSIHDGWRRVKTRGEWLDRGTGRVVLAGTDEYAAAVPSRHGPGVAHDVLVRGGWVAPDGTHFMSEFRRVVIAGVTAVERVARHCMDAAMPQGVGPFCWVSHAQSARGSC